MASEGGVDGGRKPARERERELCASTIHLSLQFAKYVIVIFILKFKKLKNQYLVFAGIEDFVF